MGRRPPAGVPEMVQSPMRNRLRMLRVSRGLSRSEVKTVSETTLSALELHDVSKVRLGDLYGLSLEYGLAFNEFLSYLVGDNDHEITDEARRMQRMAVFLRSLPDEMQELACDLVQKLVAHHVDNQGLRRVQNAPGVRRESRTIVRNALSKKEG